MRRTIEVATLLLIVGSLGCSRHDTAVEQTLDCSTDVPGYASLEPIRDILRIALNTKKASNFAFSPVLQGTADISEGEYVLHFPTRPAGYELRFRINRFTKEGWSELLNDRGERDEKVFYGIACKVYQGKDF